MTPSLKFETTESHPLLTPRRIITCAILLTMIPSCAVLQSSRGGSTTAAQPSSVISTNASSNQNSQTAIPVLSTTSFAEQQSLIDGINRDGQPANYSGFREDVPVPTATQGEDIVELNYEQADLRLGLFVVHREGSPSRACQLGAGQIGRVYAHHADLVRRERHDVAHRQHVQPTHMPNLGQLSR